MNDTLEQNPVKDEAEETSRMRNTPGMRVSSLREQQGLSQAEVAEALHLTVHYVKALEKDEYQKLPARIFVKGYYKSYAELLETNPDTILRSFDELCEIREDYKSDPSKQQRKKARDSSRLWLLVAFILIVAGVFVSWWFWGRDTGMQAAAFSIVPDYLSAAEGVDSDRETPATITPRNISVQKEVTADALMMPDSKETGASQQQVPVIPPSALRNNNQALPQDIQTEVRPVPVVAGRVWPLEG